MSIRLFIQAGVLIFVPLALGEDTTQPISFTTIRGREYRNVTLVRTVGRSLECMTAAGLQRVPIVYLPEEMRARYAEVLAKHQTPKVGEPISFKTVNGADFKEVVLVRVEPDGISVATDSGVQKVRFDFLPEGFRDLFDFDEATATEYADAVKVAQTRAAVRDAQAQAHLHQLESQAAGEKALGDRAQNGSEGATANGAEPAALGTVGAQRLGTPKLGGAGQTQ